jgi:site-specific recombinase XerC
MDVDASPAAVLLAGFRSWLVAERGLSPETVRYYCNQVSLFLASLPEPVDSSVQQLDSGRVTSFMVGHCRGRNTWSAKAMATSLRAHSGSIGPRWSACRWGRGSRRSTRWPSPIVWIAWR